MFLNRERLYKALGAEGWSGIILSSPQNVYYASGFASLAHRAVGNQVYIVIPADPAKEPSMVFPMVDIDLFIESGTWVKRFYCYEQFYFNQTSQLRDGMEKDFKSVVDRVKAYGSPVEALTQALADAAIKGTVGFESRSVQMGIIDTVRKSLPAIKFIEAEDLIIKVRGVKTPEELIHLAKAAEIIEQAFAEGIECIKPGVTEEEIARRMDTLVVAKGGTQSFMVVTAGRRSAFVHSNPSSYEVQPGDWIRFDIGCTYKGYHSDIARIVTMGKPEPKVQAYYDAICAGEQAVLSSIRPGASVKGAFLAGVEATRAAGIPHYARNHTGHGLGVQLYEHPMIKATSDFAFEEGMVFTVELPYYEIGLVGMNVEDIAVVTKDGYRLLTGLDRRPFVR